MDREKKRSKALNVVKPVEDMNKNPLGFLEILPKQNEAPSSHKLQDHPNEEEKPFGLKEDKPSERHWQNQLSHPNLFHIQQHCQGTVIHRKIFIQPNSNEDLQD